MVCISIWERKCNQTTSVVIYPSFDPGKFGREMARSNDGHVEKGRNRNRVFPVGGFLFGVERQGSGEGGHWWLPNLLQSWKESRNATPHDDTNTARQVQRGDGGALTSTADCVEDEIGNRSGGLGDADEDVIDGTKMIPWVHIFKCKGKAGHQGIYVGAKVL
jgi:hypothetical protein